MSFRTQFESVWRSILDFNQKFLENRDSFLTEKIEQLEDIQIPYMPLRINPYLFNRIFSQFAHIFNSDNGNAIEIVYKDDSHEIIGITLIKTDEMGNYIEIIENPLPNLKISANSLKDQEQLFESMKSQVLEKFYIDLGGIRLINSKFLESMEQFIDLNYERIELGNYLKNFMEISVNAIKNDWISVFPEIPLFSFVKKLLSIFPDMLRFINSFSFIKNLLAGEKISVTLHGEDWYVSIIIAIDQEKNEINLNIRPAFELGAIDPKNSYKWITLLKKIKKRYKKQFEVKSNYIVDAGYISELIFDLTESQLPLEESRFLYLLQKLLYGIKKVETYWDVSPKPITYIEGIRYVLRLIGMHISPRKLSYWALPELSNFAVKKNFGIDFRIMAILGDLTSKDIASCFNNDSNPNNLEELLSNLNYIMLNVKNMAVTEIKYLTKDDIAETLNENSSEGDHKEDAYSFALNILKNRLHNGKSSLEMDYQLICSEFHKRFGEKYGYFNAILFINSNFLYKLIKSQSLELNTWNPLPYFKAIKTLGDMRKVDNLYVYPDLPVYQYFKTANILKIIMQTGPILFDFKEF